YDITASPEGRTVERKWVRRMARLLDIPFCVAGGIRTVSDATRLLNEGAEKVSLSSPALSNPTLIDHLARRFGSQSVVIAIDSQRNAEGYRVWELSGDPSRARDTGRATLAWVHEVQERGAGEIVLNCMGCDGVRNGYDIQHLSAVRGICKVPLVAS